MNNPNETPHIVMDPLTHPTMSLTPIIVQQQQQDEDEDEDEGQELPLVYKKKKNKKTNEKNNNITCKVKVITTNPCEDKVTCTSLESQKPPSPSSLSPSSSSSTPLITPLPEYNKPSRRGISKPGIKTALPPTEVESSLRTSEDSTILSPGELLVLAGWIPKTQRLHEFNLTYVLKRDGACLDTVYSHCSDPDIVSSFIVMEDKDGYVFGGFLNEAFKKSDGYYGTGESFVFSIRPELKVYRWNNDGSDNSSSGHSYNNSDDADGSNIDNSSECSGGESSGDYMSGSDLGMFALSDSGQLLMGGGKSGYAFRVDDELCRGHSQPCGTYCSKRLSKEEFFTCVNAEVWTTRPAIVTVPLPPFYDPLKKPAISFATTATDDPPIVLTKKSTTKSRVANPSSLSFVTTTPVKKGCSNALNQWKFDAATIIQSNWRRCKCSHRFASVRQCTINIQKLWRGYIGRREASLVESKCELLKDVHFVNEDLDPRQKCSMSPGGQHMEKNFVKTESTPREQQRQQQAVAIEELMTVALQEQVREDVSLLRQQVREMEEVEVEVEVQREPAISLEQETKKQYGQEEEKVEQREKQQQQILAMEELATGALQEQAARVKEDAAQLKLQQLSHEMEEVVKVTKHEQVGQIEQETGQQQGQGEELKVQYAIQEKQHQLLAMEELSTEALQKQAALVKAEAAQLQQLAHEREVLEDVQQEKLRIVEQEMAQNLGHEEEMTIQQCTNLTEEKSSETHQVQPVHVKPETAQHRQRNQQHLEVATSSHVPYYLLLLLTVFVAIASYLLGIS